MRVADQHKPSGGVVSGVLLLNKNGVRNSTVRRLFVDLYTDCIYAGLDAMKSSVAL